MPRYEVVIEYLGRASYVLDAPQQEEAERRGQLAFMSEDGIDGEIRKTTATEVSPETPDGSAMELFKEEAPKSPVQLWRVEHGPEYEPAPFFLALLAAGKVVDWSWHNDTCPHFATEEKRDGRVLEVYMEAARPEDREAPEVARYSFYWGDDNGSDETPVFCTNDDAEAEQVFEKFFAGEPIPEGGIRWWEPDEQAPLPDECNEECLTHAKDCDGYCDHVRDGENRHVNACEGRIAYLGEKQIG